MAPKFSIITVCRNEAENIRQTCESICSQTYSDFEWIIIDGESTDGTLDILAEYSSKISCFVSEPDGGIYDAMNKGVQRATGEYLLFLNGGDYLADECALARVAAAPDRDVLYGDLLYLRDDGTSYIQAFPDMLSSGFLARRTLPHQASFIRRGLFLRYGMYDTSIRISADYDLFVRFLHVHKASYFHIPCVLAVFRSGGISCLKPHLNAMEYHEIRKKHFSWLLYGRKRLKTEWRIRFDRSRFPK